MAINAGLRSVKRRHLVMRFNFRNLDMCCFFLLTQFYKIRADIPRAEDTLGFLTQKTTPQYCFGFCLPWFERSTTLCQGVSEVRVIGFLKGSSFGAEFH